MRTLRRVFTAVAGCGLATTFALALLVSCVPTHVTAAPFSVQDKGRGGDKPGGDKPGSDRGISSGKEANGHDPKGGRNDSKGGGSGYGDPPDRGGRRP